ncbi:MAG: recombinase family protein [Dorea sp.]
MSYCIYLRKSRKDLEAEHHGEGETLARHEQTLLSLAKKHGLIIGAIYREIVSGETIAARPVMQQLLREVEQDLWDGVLVMEVERLARGDTIDQGVVQRAFQYSNTLIITPIKTYDPANEFDQEYFEFGLFMSRREYKTTKRRMQAGRYSAVREGKWPFNQAPYGWDRVKLSNEKGWSLTPNEEEAPVVKLIFSLFTGSNRIGVTNIRHYLNSRGIKARNGSEWTDCSVRGVLTNIVNDKKVGIGRRKVVSKVIDGVPVKIRPHSDYEFVVEGRQPRLIDHDIFTEAQSYLGLGAPKPPESYGVKNPLSGIMICSECKKKMFRRPAGGNSKYDVLMCKTDHCPTIGSSLDLVEQKLLETLEEWVKNYKLDPVTIQSQVPEKEHLLSLASKEHEQLLEQNERLYDLLEQGVYDTNMFLKRSQILQDKIRESDARIKELEKELEYEKEKDANINSFIPNCENLLSCYWDLSTEERNTALKLLLDGVEYRKTKKNKWGDGKNATFELILKPRIPRI